MSAAVARPARGAGANPLVAAWLAVRRLGGISAVVAVYLCIVGIVPVFNDKPLVDGFISLGQAFLVGLALVTGYLAARRVAGGPGQAILAGLLAAGIAGAALSALVLIGSVVNVRAVLLNASDDLYMVLTLGLGSPGSWASGAWVPFVVAVGLGALGGGVERLPSSIREPVIKGTAALVVMGLFANLIRTPMIAGGLGDIARIVFAQDGLKPVGAVLTLVVVVGALLLNRRIRLREAIRQMPRERRRTLTIPGVILLILIVLVLPQTVGPFIAQVVAIIALYILMGFGLNITLGLAGLLDLGFVAFFAVGAYTVGLLTSTAEFGIAQWSFWQAVPFAVILAMLFGGLLGLPILSIRGDYLAIATLGFGEIIKILAGSDLLKPWLGGPRGILNIPKPIEVPPDTFLAGPNQIYYLALLGALLVAFISMRLRSSRLGRAWVAIREDEDVAEAIGISLVQTKLLAYMLGAGFAGLGGAVFAGLIGSIFASSIDFFVSINVAAIVIVGGMGSIPGVVAGSIFLIGLPELFREFSDYRFLFYGLALIGMMLYRPEGLLPSKIIKRELHDEPAEQAAALGAGSDPAAAPAPRPLGE